MYEMNMWGYISDIETPDRYLNYYFDYSPDSLIASFVDSTGQLVLSSPGLAGHTKLQITVEDDSLVSVSDIINVNIEVIHI